MVRICSKRITESLLRPTLPPAMLIWVGSRAFPVWLVMAAALVLLLCFADIANQSRGFAYDVSFGVVVLAIAFLSSWAGFNFLEVGWIYPLVYVVIAVNGAVMLLYLLWDRRQRRGQTTK